MARNNAYVIAVGNQVPGTGKTSNILHLAAGLGEIGKKCLIIDLDANCCATRALGLHPERVGSLEILLGDHDPKGAILANGEESGVALPRNVDVLPARRNLEIFAQEYSRRPVSQFASPADCLEKPLAELRSEYDFIFLDTASNTMGPTVAAYRSADWFLLSTDASDYSFEGFRNALKDINAARDSTSPNLSLLGVVICKVSGRTRTADACIEKIHKFCDEAGENGPFETLISRTIAINKPQSWGVTLFQADPTHKVTNQYRQLIEEMMKRLDVAIAMKKR